MGGGVMNVPSMVKVSGKSKPPAARCATLKAGCECPHPSFLGSRAFAKIWYQNNQNLFIKRFKSLAPGRAAGGVHFYALTKAENFGCR
ncbi:hypothetical protein DSLASN_31630 [Desulfoluna limicola]|uniref:Uncharacterized protein n=1 Tax=Desulfoluna limicola TaxID=2810562 RepID=A0ABM7PK09_9BACT|nr:hypothetical protein DSLASN_31630 [Desulfoluna limicola]